MPSNKDKTSLIAQPRRSRAEEEAEEARLDALIAAPAKASSRPIKSVLTSKIGQSRTEQKSVMPSRLDKPCQEQRLSMPSRLDTVRMEQKSNMPSKLDKSAAEKSKMSSRLDESRLEQWKVASRLEQAEMDDFVSKLDKTSLENKHPEVAKGAVKTTFTNPHDVEMASRQTKYDTLPPAEQHKQEEWAQQKIRDIGMCPAGFGWLRVPGGYNCVPGAHWMSDELIAEGKGGWYGRLFRFAERQATTGRRDHFLGLGRQLTPSLLGSYAFRDIGFSQGLNGFHGPHYWSPFLRYPNQPRPRQFNALINPGQQSRDQQQALFNLFNGYGNNQGPFDYPGRRPF